MKGWTTIMRGAAIAAVSAQAAAAQGAAAPAATTMSGPVIGLREAGVEAFKGIPFAAPPTGGLRWRAPQASTPWTAPRAATAYGHDCVQIPFLGDAAPLGTTPSEDCLVLNVWRPAGTVPGAKLPVMVWIYGGGFVNGGSSAPTYSGAAFAKQGIVFVSFNYRLGRFGFFGFPELTREARDGGLLGNFGYLDQIAALKWIKANIERFGGDPEKVTIFGESAGGSSVLAMLTSPLTGGLFNRAIIESGGGRSGIGPERQLTGDTPGAPSADTIGVQYARSVGITGTGPAALAALRALPADKLAADVGLVALFTGKLGPYSGPVIDGKIVREPSGAAMAAGRWHKVPIIAGANSADLGLEQATSKDEIFATFGDRAPAARNAYDPDGRSPAKQVIAQVAMNRMMVEPARFIVGSAAGQGVPAWSYRFSYVAESARAGSTVGAGHATEIPYVMDTVSAKYGSKLVPLDQAMADRVHAYWVNFAKTGDPNGTGLPAWPRFDRQADIVMIFQADASARAEPDPLKHKLDLVEPHP